MKKKTVITAGILGVLAVAAGVWFYHPAGKVDQEILSRLEGDYGIPYDDDMDDEEYYDNECFWEMAVFTKADGFFTTKPPALMIYDAEAGEPGLAGTIINLADIDQRHTRFTGCEGIGHPVDDHISGFTGNHLHW